VPEEGAPGSSRRRAAKDRLVRRLALLKLCELRRAGMSRSEIRLRLGMEGDMGPMVNPASSGLSLPFEPLFGVALANGGPQAGDQRAFLAALDALYQGIAFFSGSGTPLHTNRALAGLLKCPTEGERLRAELQHFAASLTRLIRLRELANEPHVEELATREVPIQRTRYRMRGSFIGMDLFGTGPSLLITLERSTSDSPSDEILQERFGFSKQQSRIARFLVEGCSN
jgi:hypothetical protein